MANDPLTVVPLTWGHHGRGCLHIADSLLHTAPFVDFGSTRVLPSSLAEGGGALPGMAGRLSRVEGGACFEPRYPFVEGTRYSAIDTWNGTARLLGSITRPAPLAVPTTRVEAICPAVAEVPFNLLKLYVEFSAPMSEGFAIASVSVWRDGVEKLEGVFLDGPELWDRERKRLTMLLDPGRIKRGLVPHEEAGYPLVEGDTIEVRVAETFTDAAGAPLVAPRTVRYVVIPAMRTRVEPAKWQRSMPPAGSIEPLIVTFDRPLDHALVRRCIAVRREEGARIAGIAEPSADDTGWSFAPASRWRPGRYLLAIQTYLEDLSGNSVRRVFDRDLDNPDDYADVGGVLNVPFVIEPPR